MPDTITEIVGEILASSPEKREVMIKSCEKIPYEGDNEMIMEAIRKCGKDLKIQDLYLVFPEEHKSRLISLCMKEWQKYDAKKIIKDLEEKKLMKYSKVFEEYT